MNDSTRDLRHGVKSIDDLLIGELGGGPCESRYAPRVVIETADNKSAACDVDGIAALLGKAGRTDAGTASVAYSYDGGTAWGGHLVVALSRNNGLSRTSDGGVSVAHHAGDAICGRGGVAVSISPSETNIGRVRGGYGATLVIICSIPGENRTISRAAQVCDVVDDDLQIQPGVYYTLDADDDYKWIARDGGHRAPE